MAAASGRGELGRSDDDLLKHVTASGRVGAPPPSPANMPPPSPATTAGETDPDLLERLTSSGQVLPSPQVTRGAPAATAAATAPAARSGGWASVRNAVDEHGAASLATSRRGDTVGSAGKNLLLMLAVVLAWLTIGGVSYSAMERDNELRAAAEYNRWQLTIQRLKEEEIITGDAADVAGNLLSASNPDQTEVAARQREQADSSDEPASTAGLFDTCSPDCLLVHVGDGVCHTACLTGTCDMDGGDCVDDGSDGSDGSAGASCHSWCDGGCDGETSADCLACADGYVAHHNNDGSGTATCLPVCHESCGDHCADTASTDCLSCAAGYWMVGDAPAACLPWSPPCTADQYESIAPSLTNDRECEACDAACDGCVGPTNSSCVSCNAGFVAVAVEQGGESGAAADGEVTVDGEDGEDGESVADVVPVWCVLCDDSCGALCTGPELDQCVGCQSGRWQTDSTGSECTLWSPICGEDEFEEVAPTETNDRVCTPCDPNCAIGCTGPLEEDCSICPDGQWLDEDEEECMPVTECAEVGIEYELAPPTTTSDRLCANATACNDGTEYEHAPATESAPADCRPCNGACDGGCDGPSASDCIFRCSFGYFDTGGTTEPPSGTCTPYTVCDEDTEVETVAPSPTNDRECATCDVACDGCTDVGADNCEACNPDGYCDEAGTCVECATCDPDCDPDFLGDGECDAVCNNADCNFDCSDSTCDCARRVRLRRRLDGSVVRIDEHGREVLAPLRDWDVAGAMFFTFTLVTTIGYGSAAPTTTWAKLFLMVYSLVGIAAVGVLLDGIARFILLAVTKVYASTLRRVPTSSEEVKVLGGLAVAVMLTMGLFVSVLEWGMHGTASWSAWEGIYWAFITLTSVGLGDYAPTTHVSKSLTIIFSCVGLGLLASLLSAVSAALADRAKQLKSAQVAAVNVAQAAAGTAVKSAQAGETSADGSRSTFICCGGRKKSGKYLKTTLVEVAGDDGKSESKPDAAGDAGNGSTAGTAGGNVAQAQWSLAAHSAVSAVRSRRGDTVTSLLPHTLLSMVAFVLVLLVGGLVFSALESEAEERRLQEYNAFGQLVSYVQNHTGVTETEASMFADMLDAANPNLSARLTALRSRLQSDLAVPVTEQELDAAAATLEGVQKWDVVGAMFFALTISTTVGYGTYSTTSAGAQVFTIIYALVGIGLLASCVDAASRFILALTTAAQVRRDKQPPTATGEARIALGATVVVWILFAGVFSQLQADTDVPWTFFEALYFCFVTSTTIGLGDMVPTTGAGYVVLFVYMIISLGLFAMTLSSLRDVIVHAHFRLSDAARAGAARVLGKKAPASAKRDAAARKDGDSTVAEDESKRS